VLAHCRRNERHKGRGSQTGNTATHSGLER
jgi:hypothetical protein